MKIRSLITALLVLLSAGLVLWARVHPAAVLHAFLPWSRFIQGILSSAFGWIPFALSEFILYALIIGVVVCLLLALIQTIRRRSGRPMLCFLSHTVLTAAALVFVFLSVWGLNYYAPTLPERLQLTTAPASPQTLYQTTVWLRDEMISLADKVPRNTDGVCAAGGFDALAPHSCDGFYALTSINPNFLFKPARPKPFTASVLMSELGIGGVFCPFFSEPMVNIDAIDAHLPFTICHEMAHSAGFAFEDEANFIAFLACINNNNPVFSYSGYHLAFIYCSNALSAADNALFNLVWEDIPDTVSADFRAQREHLKKYEGPVKDLGSAVNDAYLKTMNQPEGEKSYGLVVDLLIADYLSKFGIN
jgi:hypothetical protein